MNFQNLLAAFHIWRVNTNLAVETARTQKSRVKNVRTVGGRNQNHVGLDVEAVHLHEHLVEGLLTFVVATTHTGTTVATYGINFIDEDNRGGVLLSLFEQVTNTAGTHTNKHFNEVGTRNREEGNTRFTSNSTCEKSFTRSGRAIEEHTLRDASSHGQEAFGLFEEVNNFCQFFHGLVGTCHVSKGDGGGFFGDHLGAGLTKLHHTASPSLHGGEHEPEEGTDQDNGQEDAQHAEEPVLFGNLIVKAIGEVGRVNRINDLNTTRGNIEELHVRAVFLICFFELEIYALLNVNNGCTGNLVVFEEGQAIIGAYRLESGHGDQRGANPDRNNSNNDVQQGTAQKVLQFHGLLRVSGGTLCPLGVCRGRNHIRP